MEDLEQIKIKVPVTKTTPAMVKMIEEVICALSNENLKTAHSKLKSVGAEKLNSKLESGFKWI